MPASHALGRADYDLAGEPGIDLVLKRALEAARPRDFVLIDCPPQLGILVAIALATCHQVLVSVATHVMELHGLADLTSSGLAAQPLPHDRAKAEQGLRAGRAAGQRQRRRE